MSLVYSTHQSEIEAVFNRPDGKVYKKDWEDLVKKLFKQYTPLINKVMGMYINYDKNLIKSACILGFYTGLRKYVNDEVYLRGFDLAAHLKLYMRNACNIEIHNDTPIHIPMNIQNAIRKYKREGVFDKRHDELNEDELIVRHDLETNIFPLLEETSLDTPINEDGNTIEDITPSDKITEVIYDLELESRREMLIRNIDKLAEVEKYCLVHYCGLDNSKRMTLRDISHEVGYSHTKVSQIVSDAITKIAVNILDQENIADFSDSNFIDYTPNIRDLIKTLDKRPKDLLY